MKHANIYHSARQALVERKVGDLLSLAEALISSDHAPAHASGYLLRGMAYELGGDGVEQDLERAAADYRKAATLAPDAIPYLYLARTLMKQGGERHRTALRYIKEAESIRKTPEVDLAYAKYFESGQDPDLVKARHYYTRAALAGRFAGFFGYAQVSRRMGQGVRAACVDCLRLVVGPFLFLLLGREASKTL